ncbi:MAG: hypothetical protein CMF69_10500 [Magnetovibrio sp.]|nr:hypothetical protein [Magnetovibrio sp.]
MLCIDEEMLNSIAHRMLSDYDMVNPGTVFSGDFRLDLADAWRLQTAVTNLRLERGETVAGYKIGCTTGGAQKRMGLLHPAWGRIWVAEQHVTGVALKKDGFSNVALEAEFAVLLKRAVDPQNASTETIVEAVENIYPVIEIHNLVWRGGPPYGAELIANNCIHAGVVRGPAIINPRVDVLTDLELLFDGEIVDSWQSLKWPGDILSAISWLAEEQAEIGNTLKAGDLILTGAFGPPIPLANKTRVDIVSSKFGNAFALFE